MKRANVATFRFFQFVADAFDLRFDLTGVDRFAVVFDDQSFGGIRNVRIQNARYTLQHIFDDVSALRRIHPAHEPGFVQIPFGDVSADGAHQFNDLRRLNLFVIVMHADFRMFTVAPHMRVRDAGLRLYQLFQFLKPSDLIRFAGDDGVQIELAGVAAGFRQLCADVGSASFARFIIVRVFVMMIVAATVPIVMVMTMVVLMMSVAATVVAVFVLIVIASRAVRVVFVVIVMLMVIVVARVSMLMIIVMFVVVITIRPVLMLVVMIVIVAAARMMDVFVWSFEYGQFLL